MQSFVEKILEALAQAGVEFIIVGGVSATKRAAGRVKALAVLPLLEATLEATRRA
jgi:hypothetical protein